MPEVSQEVFNDNIESNNSRSWSSLIWQDSKKILGTVGLLGTAVGLKTVQRVLQVAVTKAGTMDWQKLNPVNDWFEFAVTPVQLVISTQAMNLWKWGTAGIWTTGKSLFGINTNEERIPLLSLYTEIVIEEGYSCLSKTAIIGKVLMTKMGYWLSNHFMITASSMYSVGSLTSFAEYWTKILYGPNILSTILRAEVLCYSSLLIDKGIEYLATTNMWSAFKRKWCSYSDRNELAEATFIQSKWINLLKVGGYGATMLLATIVDNAIKTAAVMYSADRLPDFCSTFFQEAMFALMIGLIINDTLGNKVLNKYANNQIQKFLKAIGCCQASAELNEVVITHSQPLNINGDYQYGTNNAFSDEVVRCSNNFNNTRSWIDCPRDMPLTV